MYIEKTNPAPFDPCEAQRMPAPAFGRASSVHQALTQNAIFRRLSVALLADLIRRTVREPYVHWRRRKTAIAQLEALDDRILRDIGLERGQIASAVDDLLACRDASPPRAAKKSSISNRRKSVKVEQIMNKAIDPIDPATTLANAARTMRDEDVGFLLVGRVNDLRGVVTDRDIVVRALALGLNPNRDPVTTVMSNMVVWCFMDQPIEAAAKLMAEHGVRRLPVLDREGGLRGVVSLSAIRGRVSRKKPWQVTFYRKIADRRGKMHKTPLTTLYIAKLDCKVKAAAAARRLFAGDAYPPSMSGAADGYRIDRESSARAASDENREGAEQFGHFVGNGEAKLSPPMRSGGDAVAFQ